MKNWSHKNTYNILWICSCLGIFLLSKINTGHIALSYVLFYSLLVAFTLKYIKNTPQAKLNFPIFIISSILVTFNLPFLENDHYRYLFEGKSFIQGINPYLTPPKLISSELVYFSEKSKIAYPELSSIYPPFALLFFSIVSKVSFPISLKILMIINSIIAYFFINHIIRNKTNTNLIILTFPLIIKEYIHSIHIDFLAAIFLYMFFYSKNKYLLCLSIWTKLISILTIPFLYINDKNKKSLIFITISLPIFLIFYVDDYTKLTGIMTFTKYWSWNSLYFNIFKNTLNLGPIVSKKICIVSFFLFYIFLLFEFYKKKIDLPKALLLLYSGLMFFSPVYNPWYGIWILIFSLKQNNKILTIYAIAGTLGYLGYEFQDYKLLSSFACHFLFLIYVYKSYIKRAILNK